MHSVGFIGRLVNNFGREDNCEGDAPGTTPERGGGGAIEAAHAVIELEFEAPSSALQRSEQYKDAGEYFEQLIHQSVSIWVEEEGAS